jgi:hypothetical protein
VFRSSQKHVERELAAIQAATHDLSKRSETNGADPQDAVRSVEGMIARVENLKRKVLSLSSFFMLLEFPNLLVISSRISKSQLENPHKM